MTQEISAYYDEHLGGKLSGFVEGNERVECAWETIAQWAPAEPHRILEIGCGIGDICWRMSRRWPEATVMGLDISPKSLEAARKLFGSPRLSFAEGTLVKGKLSGKFDLIVLMDVYEHIAVQDRASLHEALAELQTDGGRIVLAFPTPRHQAWLRQYHPHTIQPVDEDINMEILLVLAHDTRTELLLYQEVNVWYEGDYAHAVLGKREEWRAVDKTVLLDDGIRKRIRNLLFGRPERLIPERSERLALVQKRLGGNFIPSGG